MGNPHPFNWDNFSQPFISPPFFEPHDQGRMAGLLEERAKLRAEIAALKQEQENEKLRAEIAALKQETEALKAAPATHDLQAAVTEVLKAETAQNAGQQALADRYRRGFEYMPAPPKGFSHEHHWVEFVAGHPQRRITSVEIREAAGGHIEFKLDTGFGGVLLIPDHARKIAAMLLDAADVADKVSQS